MRSSRSLLLLLTVIVGGACGKEERGRAGAPAPAGGGSGPPAVDTTAAGADSAPPAPALPSGFPSDFPLPPDHVVLEASVQADDAGTFASARLAIPAGDVIEPTTWYRQALVDAGWQIAAEGSADGSRTLHATQGESYIDLTVRPDPARRGRIVVEASIWKVEAL